MRLAYKPLMRSDDLLADKLFPGFEGFEFPDVSWLNADILLLQASGLVPAGPLGLLTHPLSSMSAILLPFPADGFQIVQLMISHGILTDNPAHSSKPRKRVV
jgi:hypothetical protein